ncbi:hypothetical protein PHYSODRAFT_469004 [Phytophthora sojae]|uniref:CCHC-type domain-containing protein n=1 Tax=Phytophthora sojae (strain P6497) TaxID=1094619 RepID=G4YNK2_PHYSP|nr:hypothetical protein PHYSODRAFT_469004 [Phytophthora sojae]EGZ30401.1 hypothetical protein PHYSODRAFT_469004 [Phytophthora sojae]|eukprot:XP_009517676.1 hypothetical protein PHYSODRAFT_469004 [Phytophthora sojae]
MSGGDWPEEFRILALNGKLDGTALVYFERMVPLWTAESPTLEHVMNRMLVSTWAEHCQYLTYGAERSGCSDLHVLQSLCKSAPPYLQSAMLTRLNSQRVDYLQQATELVAFAIEFEANMLKQEIGRGQGGRGNRGRGGRFHGGGRGDQGGRGSVARVDGTETRSCYNCGEAGHLARDCPGKENSGAKTSTRLLRNAVDCDEQCRAANGDLIHVVKKGTVVLRTIVDSNEVIVDLSDVYYGDDLPDNIISYGILEEKGVYLERHGGKLHGAGEHWHADLRGLQAQQGADDRRHG